MLIAASSASSGPDSIRVTLRSWFAVPGDSCLAKELPVCSFDPKRKSTQAEPQPLTAPEAIGGICSQALQPQFADYRSLLFLCVPRVVRRVQVINAAGTSPAQLNDRLARCPSKMLHSSGHEKIAPGRHRVTGAGVELFAHADIKCPGKSP
jgi:hypothetical protein